jgi:hypothetical protein
MKAYKIDVVKRCITPIEIKSTQDIYDAIGNNCEIFSCPISLKNGDTIFVDDEGLIKDKLYGCFSLRGFEHPLVGNALLIGTTEHGHNVDVAIELEKFETLILWGSENMANVYRRNFMLTTMPKIVLN